MFIKLVRYQNSPFRNINKLIVKSKFIHVKNNVIKELMYGLTYLTLLSALIKYRGPFAQRYLF